MTAFVLFEQQRLQSGVDAVEWGRLKQCKERLRKCWLSMGISIVALTTIFISLGYNSPRGNDQVFIDSQFSTQREEDEFENLHDRLLSNGKYSTADFSEHEKEIPYWNELQPNENSTCCNEEITTCPRVVKRPLSDESHAVIPHFGPCYLPPMADWRRLGDMAVNTNSSKNIVYRPYDESNAFDLTNFCRPGFIIIGAGKCGTSSLYHYLTGHPRVLPASEKQIHYFKNGTHMPMSWYLSHFPSTETFLSHGALMTGEASPGYLPRPEVAFELQYLMRTYAGNGKNQNVAVPKIITIARNPLERSWSSYKYNYADPTLQQLKKDRSDLEGWTDEEMSKEFLFSFEEMIGAELNRLKECLVPGGEGETLTNRLYSGKEWATQILHEKRSEGTPLVALDESCYGDVLSPSVPRRQWKDLVEKFPNKMINVPNLHVVQSIIGRSLYTFPLEWWYALYRKKDLYVVCNEDLKFDGSNEVSKVANFLGLPSYNFTDVVSAGMFNVQGNRGYDTVTKWDDLTRRKQEYEDIPISDKLKESYLSFVKPYNERLFQLVGKRCKW